MPDIAAYSLELALSVWGSLPSELTATSTESAQSVAVIEQIAVPQLVSESAETVTSLATIIVGPSLTATSTETTSSAAQFLDAMPVVTARQVGNEVLRMWGMCCDTDPEDCLKDEILGVLNGALQFIHANGRELPYLAKRTRVHFLAETDSIIELDSDVQNVEGTVRAISYSNGKMHQCALSSLTDDRCPFYTGGTVEFAFQDGANTAPLTLTYGADFVDADSLRYAIQSRIVNGATCLVNHVPGRILSIVFDIMPRMWRTYSGPTRTIASEIDDSVRLFSVGDGTTVVGSSAITGLDTDRLFVPVRDRTELDRFEALFGTDAGTPYYLERNHEQTSDSTRCRIHIFQNIGADVLVGMDVQVEPARINWSDYLASTVIPLPHAYVESLFLPIVRYRATASRRYRQKERHEAVLEQYRDAVAMLGIVDPQTPAVKEGKEAAP